MTTHHPATAQTADHLNASVSQSIAQAAALIRTQHKIAVLSGAGISAESGIPTFRDKQTGLWQNFRAEELASVHAFERDPQLVWSWYQWRRSLVQDKSPNPAHHALARWQQNIKQLEQQLYLITQNVDDLHEQAGSEVTHLHGHLWRNRCSQCNRPYDQDMNYKDDNLLHCPECDGHIRPDIVWFGEMLPARAWQYAEQAANDCDVFISIGTSSIVYPAAGLVELAKRQGASVIEINPNPTHHPVVDIQISAKAGTALPLMVDALLA